MVAQVLAVDESGAPLAGGPVALDMVAGAGIQTQWYSYDSMNRLSSVAVERYQQINTGWDESGSTGWGTVQGGPIPIPGTDESGIPLWGAVSDTGTRLVVDLRQYDGAGRTVHSGSAGALFA